MKFGKYKHKNSTNKDDQTRLMVKLLDKYFTENYDNKRFKKSSKEDNERIRKVSLNDYDDYYDTLYGTKYKGYRGLDAINKLLETKEGWCLNAFTNKELGGISLAWGHNNVKNEGFGLKHIIEKHKENKEYILSALEDVIANGIVYNDYSKNNINRKIIKKDNIRVVIDAMIPENLPYGPEMVVTSFYDKKDIDNILLRTKEIKESKMNNLKKRKIILSELVNESIQKLKQKLNRQPIYFLAGPCKGYCLYCKGLLPIIKFKKCAIQIGFKKKDFYETLNKGLEIIINTKNPEDIGLYILIKVDKTKKRGEYKQFGIALEWGCKIIEKEDRNEIDTMDYTGIVTTILNSKEVKDIQLNNRQLFIENINQFQQNLNKSTNIYNKGFAPFEFNNIHLEEFFKWVDTGKEYANYEIIEIE